MHARVVGCAPVPNARPGSTTTASSPAGGVDHGGPIQRPPAAPGDGTPSSGPPSPARRARPARRRSTPSQNGLARIVGVDRELDVVPQIALLDPGGETLEQPRSGDLGLIGGYSKRDASERRSAQARSSGGRRSPRRRRASARRPPDRACGRHPRAGGAARRRVRSARRRRAERTERASARAPQRGHALPCENAHLAGLRAGRHLELEVAGERRDRRRRSERCVGHRQAHRGVEVVAVPHEPRVGSYADDDERVAALGAPESGVPLAAHRICWPSWIPRGIVDLELRAARDDRPSPLQSRARLLEHLARAAAVRARPLLDELAEDVLRDAAGRRPAPSHVGQRRADVPGSAPDAAAALARRRDLERHRAATPGERLLELDLDDGLDVAAALRAAALPRRRRGGPRRRTRRTRRRGCRSRRTPARTRRAGGRPCRSGRRVARRSGVGEHLVRLGDLAEPRSASGCSRDVGVQLARERPERTA